MRTGGLDPFQPVCIGGFREFIDKPAESPAVDSGGQYATCLRAAQLDHTALTYRTHGPSLLVVNHGREGQRAAQPVDGIDEQHAIATYIERYWRDAASRGRDLLRGP